MKKLPRTKSDPRPDLLLQGKLHDPFAFLGLHQEQEHSVLRFFQPYATEVHLVTTQGEQPLKNINADGLFEWQGAEAPTLPYQLRVVINGKENLIHDPYSFPPQINSFDLHLFNEGKLHQAYRTLGSHVAQVDGVEGIRFAVWAPNAARVGVIGEFNQWDGRVHTMAVHGSSGVWELFIPGLAKGELYKYEIYNRAGVLIAKTDPY